MAVLEGYGLHELTWETCDDLLGCGLVASPADAQGRGISLSIKQNGAAADLTGAKAYLVWRHRELRKRGTTEFEAVDASAGTFVVYYPAAMACAEGTVDAQVIVSEGDNAVSSRTFEIRVEQVLVGGDASEDGFTLFVEAIKAYEGATLLDTAATEAANKAAEAANAAAAEIKRAAAAGEFDGADGAKGDKGDKGDTGETGPQGPKGDTGDTGPQGETGPKGDTGATGAAGADGEDGVSCTHSWSGTTLTVTSASGTSSADLVGPQGPQGVQGEAGPQGETGPQGNPGADGTPCMHSWNGATLTVTSASGTSSADLKGEKGDTGDTGPAGASGTSFMPASPLSLVDGSLSIDLSAYATKEWVAAQYPDLSEVSY
ncbi:MAG: BppU family phage baseplate upper protein [Parolsenella sp.]|uniref:BppU family phage baseplate upper protein n=1 Tax=Parolsenella sp. TaxID=2083006 RepID=UPI002E79C1B2|nr:BppU family phage baseplate upper protein [Parolsenella sp.]MEE1372176.1 BppU family phage baseplate upper protein [Parolsenella sp.]